MKSQQRQQDLLRIFSFESPRVSSPHSPSWANRCPWPKGRHACVYLAPLKAAENDDEADENGKEEEKEKN